MPDSRRHRGPHPEDARIFAACEVERLAEAAEHLGWLLAHGYADRPALTLVGDHFQLHQRQRLAVARAASPPERAEARIARRVPALGRPVVVDGFNVLVTAEVALSGGILVRGRDGLLRDLAGIHGTWRRVEESPRSIEILCRALLGASEVRWLLDRPVSGSGKFAALLREAGQDVALSDRVDGDLLSAGVAVATADGPVLDAACAGIDLLSPLVESLEGAWVVDLSRLIRDPDRDLGSSPHRSRR